MASLFEWYLPLHHQIPLPIQSEWYMLSLDWMGVAESIKCPHEEVKMVHNSNKKLNKNHDVLASKSVTSIAYSQLFKQAESKNRFRIDKMNNRDE